MSWIALIFLSVSIWAADVPCERVLQPETNAPDTRVLSAFAFAKQTNPDKLKTFIQYLNGEKPLWGGFELDNRSSSENREVARQAIALTLRNMDLRPEFEVFENGANVVLEITGKTSPREVVEFGAHYDTVMSGADDNGGGVALLLHLAELFKTNPPGRTVRLVFFDLEETNCDGSCYHAKQIKKDPRQFIGALVVDALGYFPKKINPKIVAAEIGRHESRLPLAHEIFYQVRRLPVDRGVQLSAELDQVDPDGADHGSYWDANIPAILIARPHDDKFNSPHNHSYRDTTDNMTWDYYVSAGKLFVELAGFTARLEMPANEIADLTEAASENRAVSMAEPLPQPLVTTKPEKKKSRGGLFGWMTDDEDDDVPPAPAPVPAKDDKSLGGDDGDYKEQMREILRREALREAEMLKKGKAPETKKPAPESPAVNAPAPAPKEKKKKGGWFSDLIMGPDSDY
jgi:hypothetical protein